MLLECCGIYVLYSFHVSTLISLKHLLSPGYDTCVLRIVELLVVARCSFPILNTS